MRVVEALAAGVVAALVVLLIAARLSVPGDRVVLAAIVFLVGFGTVILSPGYRHDTTRSRRR